MKTVNCEDLYQNNNYAIQLLESCPHIKKYYQSFDIFKDSLHSIELTQHHYESDGRIIIMECAIIEWDDDKLIVYPYGKSEKWLEATIYVGNQKPFPVLVSKNDESKNYELIYPKKVKED